MLGAQLNEIVNVSILTSGLKRIDLWHAKKNGIWLHKRALSLPDRSQSNELNTSSDSDLAGN